MRFYVGVTDNSWYGFLRNARPEEVNFWKPSAQKAFSGLEPGAPFLFKLKRPHNHANLAAEPDKRYGTPTLISPRLGQGAFRVLVTDAYKRRCAITGESTLPVLEAAHILPFVNSGPHQVSNGLLLRSDFHKLFDLGYVTVDTDLRVRVSKRIREDWFNGKAYYRLDGQPLQVLPEALDQRPKSDFLAWHNKEVFQA